MDCFLDHWAPSEVHLVPWHIVCILAHQQVVSHRGQHVPGKWLGTEGPPWSSQIATNWSFARCFGQDPPELCQFMLREARFQKSEFIKTIDHCKEPNKTLELSRTTIDLSK